ncbi:hypothetical protein J7413_03365 [Shimia sp. R10_1]|uniref:hypothetical protein n=1 Tax=Shimia sp. R10_1 TaxID=2821095 RepID=UPI001ADACF84|nr:hypothetical protein [Shimia sp. R10_1]MBO9472567.1 hypothetical protein [Shimia sp. R10_1]
MRYTMVLVPFVLMACEGAGSVFVTSNGVRVNPVNADVFEVLARPAGRASDFWCGAGHYARRALDAPDTALVYVVGGAGPGVTANTPDAAQFSLKPPSEVSGATGRAGSWGPDVGAATSVGQARRSCRDLATSSDD